MFNSCFALKILICKWKKVHFRPKIDSFLTFMLLDTTICKYRHCNFVFVLPIKLWKPPSTVGYFNKIAERPKTSLKLIVSLMKSVWWKWVTAWLIYNDFVSTWAERIVFLGEKRSFQKTNQHSILKSYHTLAELPYVISIRVRL